MKTDVSYIVSCGAYERLEKQSSPCIDDVRGLHQEAAVHFEAEILERRCPCPVWFNETAQSCDDAELFQAEHCDHLMW